MKKLLILFVLITVLAGGVYAADTSAAEQPVRFAFNFDPIGLIFFSFPFSFEYAITDSISVGAQVLYSPNFFWFTNISVLDVNAGARYYLGSLLGSVIPDSLSFLKGPAPRGVFGGVRVAYEGDTWNYSSSGDSFIGTYTSFGLGAEVGAKYFLSGLTGLSGLSGLYAEGTFGYMFFFPSKWSWTFNGQSYTWLSEPNPPYTSGGLTYAVSFGYAF
jgi:hypothetical protein